jgi:hypothetical protein
MRRLGFALVLVFGCGRVSTPPVVDDGGDRSETTAGDAGADATLDSIAPVDTYVAETEDCPDPAFPPRADGCPCTPAKPGTCTFALEGKLCFYNAYCPSEAIAYVCTLILPGGGKPYMNWERCAGDCKTEKCYSLPDAGTE